MRRAGLICLAVFLTAGALRAESQTDETYKVHVFGWGYGRERKTINSSNRVTADFKLKNTSHETLNDVTVTLMYRSGMGESVKDPFKHKVGVLKPGETRPVQIVGDFVPVFEAYGILVEYNGKVKEEWCSTCDTSQPEPKNGMPLQGTASVAVLGREAGTDRAGVFKGVIKVKNEGTVEAKNVKITATFYDDKKNVTKTWSGPLGKGVLAAGQEAEIPFTVPGAPRAYKSYELRVGCDDVSPEASLSGGEFTKAEEVEFAQFKFSRPDPKKPDLKVTCKVRNGLKESAEKITLTMTFKNIKGVEVKKFTHTVPGTLKAGEIKDTEFVVDSLPNYSAFEQAVNYSKPGAAPAPSGPSETKITPGKFKKINDLEIIFTDSATNDDKSVSLVGSLRNGKDVGLKDIVISVTFTKPDGSTLATAEKTLSEPVHPGEERNFVVKAPNAAGFDSYGFQFKYNQLAKPKGAAAQPAKTSKPAEEPKSDEEKQKDAAKSALDALGKL